ncbi:MAG: ornithine--oxo-acid transaminase [Deltaproteobacteria bacterium]|jgi:ornithine--oxo-acid transaminase|nr:ornithine--oxo-acid transaminase [Deltaproteobacteria bacterium]MBW2537939.1 ornithine--oxo-acid transaminase [Deltaproteobacteria bacterium]
MSTQQHIDLMERYSARNYKPLNVVIDRAEGIWVWDPEGNKYLDFLSCYSAVNHGHSHPEIIATLKRQADKVAVTSRAFLNAELGPFLKELCELCGADMALPMNSGAEAVETAIKAARAWGYQHKGVPEGKAEIVVCADNFHGRTVTIISFSTEPLYQKDFGPFTPGFQVIPYGDAAALERAITPNTVAFLVEPIQGEAGVCIPPEGFLARARQLCTDHRVLLIADEIQTGLGRTGKLFACDHEQVEPDLFILGKALGGGVLPISAIVGAREVLEVFVPGSHGSTFGGNPLACAVARAALRILVEQRLPERSAELGAYLMEKLRTLDNPLIKEVRGRGLFVGVELAPEAGGARRYCEQLMAKGLLCKETHDDVIRFAPPLVIEREDIDWAFERVREVLAGAEAAPAEASPAS